MKNKMFVTIIAILILLIGVLLTGCSTKAESTVTDNSLYSNVQPLAGTCPYGVEKDPSPGICPLYRDSNQDHICDLSY